MNIQVNFLDVFESAVFYENRFYDFHPRGPSKGKVSKTIPLRGRSTLIG